MTRRVIGRCHRGKTADADTDLAIAIVQNSLDDCGGSEMGWTWDARTKDLARSVAETLGRVRMGKRRRL